MFILFGECEGKGGREGQRLYIQGSLCCFCLPFGSFNRAAAEKRARKVLKLAFPLDVAWRVW